jgi:hypothetical protein
METTSNSACYVENFGVTSIRVERDNWHDLCSRYVFGGEYAAVGVVGRNRIYIRRLDIKIIIGSLSVAQLATAQCQRQVTALVKYDDSR